ncbi:MAG: hypothetical protein DKINENOH_02927 [bacterium]|nr:hypothetical protein [bacterium]MCK6558951.1 hypothetical protein [bacterium]NUM66131.1 hypothetical protein [candidate division KSB1 bacterium]
MSLTSNLPPAQICGNLRTRANYVPGWQSTNAPYHPNDHTPCFCLKTLDAFGPDDCPVHADACRPQRACFEPLVPLTV